MNILVCIKQVPGTNRVEVDSVTGVLKRDGASSKMNSYDLYGVELSLQLAEEYGGTVSAITMGPVHARSVIREAMAMGAQDGTVISDRRFAGSDVLATSYTLAQGIRRTGRFDLIICGRQTTDGDTAQVGPELAEHLGIPHVTNVINVIEMDQEKIRVKALRDGFLVEQTLKAPCLICVEDAVNTPRLPSYRRKKTIDESKIRMLSLDDMENTDEKKYGLTGSPTQVVRMFPPAKREGKEMWKGTEKENAGRIFELFQKLKVI